MFKMSIAWHQIRKCLRHCFRFCYPYVRTGFAMRISCRTRGFRPPEFAYATRGPLLNMNKGFERGSYEVQTLKPLACASLAGAA